MKHGKRKHNHKTNFAGVLAAVFSLVFCIHQETVQALVTQKQVQNNGLIGYWSLDSADISGTAVYDKSGNARNGAATGSPTAGAGKVRQDLVFSGSGQYIDLGSSPITGSQAFTLAAWIKPSAFDNNYHGAVSLGDSSASSNAYIGLIGSSAQGGTANTIGGGFYGSNYGTGVVSTDWNHVVMTFSGGSNGTVTLYVNGVSKFTTTFTPSLNSGNMKIGRIGTDTIYDFSGGIDEVYVYSRALSSTEVMALYKNTQSTVITSGDPYYSSVKALLHGEGTASSTTITDQKGHSFTTSGNAHISTTQFKYGSASFNFDGSGDQITSPDSDDWTFTGDFTMEAWIRPNTTSSTMGIMSKWNNEQFTWEVLSGGQVGFAWVPFGTCCYFITTTASISANTWTHVAVTRQGNTFRQFINGVQDSSGTQSGTPTNGSEVLRIGSVIVDGSVTRYFNGYIDDVRITKGVARYTSNFTPPPMTHPDRSAPTASQSPLNTKLLGPASGLVGYWTFDGPRLTTSTATDSLGNSDGTLKNGPIPTQGIIGQGLTTGINSSYVNVGDKLDMGLNGMTLSVWFKSTQLNQAIYGFISKSIFGNGNGRYSLYGGGSTMYAFMECGAQPQISTDLTAYNDGKWHLATATYNRTGNLTLYLDAVSKASTSISSCSAVNMDVTYPLLIGSYNDSFGGDTDNAKRFPGSLDDARIYNRALSASEVMQLYKLGSQ